MIGTLTGARKVLEKKKEKKQTMLLSVVEEKLTVNLHDRCYSLSGSGYNQPPCVA